MRTFKKHKRLLHVVAVILLCLNVIMLWINITCIKHQGYGDTKKSMADVLDSSQRFSNKSINALHGPVNGIMPTSEIVNSNRSLSHLTKKTNSTGGNYHSPDTDWPPDVGICVRKQACVNGTSVESTCDSIIRSGGDICSRLMTVIRKPARTGNQMFQIAAMLGAARLHGYTPVIPPNFGIKYIFNLPNIATLDFDNNARFGEKSYVTYIKSITDLDHATNWTLIGFFQSWKYFQGSESIVRKAFTFQEKFSKTVKTYLKRVTPAGFKVVCIHVRRLPKTARNLDYFEPTPTYIKQAVSYFRKMYKGNVTFIFVSHAMPWVKANVRIRGARYSPFSHPGTDLALMAHSDHVIVTVGTFGWWGAWLSGGKAVYWKKVVDARKHYQNDFVEAYFPNDWIGME